MIEPCGVEGGDRLRITTVLTADAGLEARLGLSTELDAHADQRTDTVSIDHLGLSKGGFATLLVLVEKGVRVKATGFGRVDFDVKTALKEICAANPEALMFGTDLPSTRAPRPYADGDLCLLLDALGEKLARMALFENAAAFYRPTRTR